MKTIWSFPRIAGDDHCLNRLPIHATRSIRCFPVYPGRCADRFEPVVETDVRPINIERTADMTEQHVMILGVGNLLFSDEGFGIRVVEELERRYIFPENVSIVDGGVLGVSLLGVMSEADRLIVVDVIRNKGVPGDLYRLEGDAIPERIRAKNSLHQIDFLEALTLCQAMEKVPEAVIVGVEPEDITTLSTELTETTRNRMEDMIQMVLSELEHLNITCHDKGTDDHVSCNPI